MATQPEITLCAVGDVWPKHEDAVRGRLPNRETLESAFALSAPTTREADIAFCNVEAMYSERGTRFTLASLTQIAHPNNIAAFTHAGFDVVSLAGNHVMDWGREALADTIALMENNDIRAVGAEMNYAEAHQPVFIERKGIRTAFLAYNSILPDRLFIAEGNKPGCAAIRTQTVYEPVEVQPGCPVRVYTFADRNDVEAMKNDIANAKKSADVVLVSQHWGLHFVPALIAMYQPEVAYAAIDAGADMIIGHHPHILKGMEFYKGKLITYSLGNFCADQYLDPDDFVSSPKRAAVRDVYPGRRLYDDYRCYSFPVDSRKSIALRCAISKAGVQRLSFLPVFINPNGQPEILKRSDRRFDEVVNYMTQITDNQALNVEYVIEGDEVLIRPKAVQAARPFLREPHILSHLGR